MSVSQELIPLAVSNTRSYIIPWLQSSTEVFLEKAWKEIWIFPSTVHLSSLSVPFQGDISLCRRATVAFVQSNDMSYNRILSLRMFLPLIWLRRISGLDVQTTFNRIRQRTLQNACLDSNTLLVSSVWSRCHFCSGFSLSLLMCSFKKQTNKYLSIICSIWDVP